MIKIYKNVPFIECCIYHLNSAIGIFSNFNVDLNKCYTMRYLLNIMLLSILFFINKNNFGQTIINGTVNTSNVLTDVERNFSGFNNGEGFIDNVFWYYGPNANLSVCNYFYNVFNTNLGNNIYYRFPGGMIANDYLRWNGGYGNIKLVLLLT